MTDFINENGYMCYVRSGLTLSDTHGAGHAELHLREFEDVANKIVDKKLKTVVKSLEDAMPRIVSEYSHEVFQRLITSLVGALETDVQSEVKIALSNAADIFYGKKAQDYISKNVMNAMLKELDKVKGMKVKI